MNDRIEPRAEARRSSSPSSLCLSTKNSTNGGNAEQTGLTDLAVSPSLAAAPLSLLDGVDELLGSDVRQVPAGRGEAGVA